MESTPPVPGRRLLAIFDPSDYASPEAFDLAVANAINLLTHDRSE